MSKTIVGIDLSFRNCGVARVSYTRKEGSSEIVMLRTNLVKTTPINTTAIKGIIDRVRQIQEFTSSLSSLVLGADEVVVEMPYGSQDSKSAKLLGYCYGVISSIETHADSRFIYVTPGDLKKWTGSAKNKKINVYDKVSDRLGDILTVKNDNIIDALGLCLMRCDQLSYEASKQLFTLKAE